MKLQSVWFRCVSAGMLLCLLMSNNLYGCSRSLAQVKVPTSFHISVLHGKEPVSGIQVAVYSAESSENDSRPVVELRTGKDGRAEIKDLREGTYIVQTEGPGQGDGVYAIVLDRYKKADAGLTLQWPYLRQEVLKLSTLAGELASNNPWTPLKNVHLELWTPGVSAPLAEQDTGPDGHFNFNTTRPGIYILRVRGYQEKVNRDNQVEGDIAVDLSPSVPAASASLYLRLGMTSCGIEYSSCPSGNDAPIMTAARRFKVLYGPGIEGEHPWIENVRFTLLDHYGAAIAEGRTNNNGVAELPLGWSGKATLVVASSGFVTIRQVLDLLPADEAAPDLVVSLAGFGSTGDHCSNASLEKHATP